MFTAAVRNEWADWRCVRGASIDMFGKRVSLATPQHEAWKAAEYALLYYEYSAVIVGTYVCRGIGGKTCMPDGTNCSLHAYGSSAIDFDPFGFGNPHFKKRYGNGWDFDDCKFTRAQVEAVEAIRTNDGEQVFRWLGWSIGDTMHFQINTTQASLATGIDRATLPGEEDDVDFEDFIHNYLGDEGLGDLYDAGAYGVTGDRDGFVDYWMSADRVILKSEGQDSLEHLTYATLAGMAALVSADGGHANLEIEYVQVVRDVR